MNPIVIRHLFFKGLLQASGFAYPIVAALTASPHATSLVYIFTAVVIIDGTFQKVSEKNITSPGIIRYDLAFIFSVAFFGIISGWGWTALLGSWLGASYIVVIVFVAVCGRVAGFAMDIYYKVLLALRLLLYLPLLFPGGAPDFLFEQAFKASGWVVLGGCALLTVALISENKNMLLWCLTAAVPVVTRRIDLLVLGVIGAQDMLLNSRLTYSLAAIPLAFIGNIRLILGRRASFSIMLVVFVLFALGCFFIGFYLDKIFIPVFVLLCMANIIYLLYVERFQYGCIERNMPGLLLKNNIFYFLLVFSVNLFCVLVGAPIGGIGELLAIILLSILVRFSYAKR
ncbi:hypothetical protein [Stutzerimonas azotifigens]|uniref:hypothetical protein n=1 Tax=Stutzerimonas azotifigens TaxID=291995 RepID=UPI0012679077|nr:hypothetical protein [Stutzerimonas azotifigens]